MIELLLKLLIWIVSSVLPEEGMDEILTVNTPEVLDMKSMFLFLLVYWTILLEAYSITFAVGPITFLAYITGAYEDYYDTIDEEERMSFYLYLMVGSCFATFLLICYVVGPDAFF